MCEILLQHVEHCLSQVVSDFGQRRTKTKSSHLQFTTIDFCNTVNYLTVLWHLSYTCALYCEVEFVAKRAKRQKNQDTEVFEQ